MKQVGYKRISAEFSKCVSNVHRVVIFVFDAGPQVGEVAIKALKGKRLEGAWDGTGGTWILEQQAS